MKMRVEILLALAAVTAACTYPAPAMPSNTDDPNLDEGPAASSDPQALTVSQCVLFEIESYACDVYLNGGLGPDGTCEGLFLVFDEPVPPWHHLGAVPGDDPNANLSDDLIAREVRYHQPIGPYGHSYFLQRPTIRAWEVAHTRIRFRIVEQGRVTYVSQSLAVGIDCTVLRNASVPTTTNHPRWMGGEHEDDPLAFGKDLACTPEQLDVDTFHIMTNDPNRPHAVLVTYADLAMEPLVEIAGTVYAPSSGDDPGDLVSWFGFGPDTAKTAIRIQGVGMFGIGVRAHNLACGVAAIEISCDDHMMKGFAIALDGVLATERWFALAEITADTCRVDVGNHDL